MGHGLRFRVSVAVEVVAIFKICNYLQSVVQSSYQFLDIEGLDHRQE